MSRRFFRITSIIRCKTDVTTSFNFFLLRRSSCFTVCAEGHPIEDLECLDWTRMRTKVEDRNRKTSRTSGKIKLKKVKHQYQIIIMLDCIGKNLRKMYAYGAFLLVIKLFLWTMIRSFKQKGIRLLALRMTEILDSIFSQKLLQYPLFVLEL